jgi:hypothetical protein
VIIPSNNRGFAGLLTGEKAQGGVGTRLQVDLDPARPTGKKSCHACSKQKK